MRLSDDELRAALRAEAVTHQPDREAMLSRIMSPPSTARRSPRSRTAAAAAAVVAILAGGGVANWALAGSSDPAPTPAPTTAPAPGPSSSSPAPLPSSTPASAPAPTVSRPASKPAATPTTPAEPPTTTPTASTGPRPQQGPLQADGSVAPGGGASVITLSTTEELTALEMVIRVARTDGLVARGGTKQTPGASVSVAVTEEADALVYRFVLASADTLAPGTYTFTAKYTDPSGSRNPAADTYDLTATTTALSHHLHGAAS